MKRDTAGVWTLRQSSKKIYLKNAIGVFLLYDITDRTSFENLSNLLKEINECSNPHVIHLIGAKSDLQSKRAVTYNEAKEFADNHGLLFTETSAKTFVF